MGDLTRIDRYLAEVLQKPHPASGTTERGGDCWCAGAGGRLEAHYAPGRMVFREYCPCPEGQRLRSVHAQEHEEYEKTLGVERAQRRMESAGVPPRYMRFSFEASPHKATAKLLGKLKGSWYLHGATGTGKTGLAVAYLKGFIEAGKGLGLYACVPELLGSIRQTYSDTHEGMSEGDIVQICGTIDCLILDDLGAEHNKGTGWLQDRLYQIIGARHTYERTTVFTSNLDPAQLGEHLGERIAWRIWELCGPGHIVEIGGPNLRARS